MESVTIIKKKKKNSPIEKEDIIILPFNEEEDDIERLIKEIEEDKAHAKEKEALKLKSEIKMLNRIRYSALSRVA